MTTGNGRNSTFKRDAKRRIFAGREHAPCCFCKHRMFLWEATLEHILPIALGGAWDQRNLAVSCNSCNQARGTQDFETFRRNKRAPRLVR